MEWVVSIVVVAAMAVAVAQIAGDPKSRRHIFVVLGLYVAYLAAGVGALLILPLDRIGGPALMSAIAAILAWIALGALWILRTTPSGRPPPAFLLRRWSVLDWGLIAVVVAGAVLAVALRSG